MLFGKKRQPPQGSIEQMQQQGRQIVPLVVTCRHLPDILVEQMKRMLSGGAIVILYPRADYYGVNGFPVSFGTALQIWLSDNIGQLCMRNLTSRTPTEIVTEGDPFAGADWYDLYREWDRLYSELNTLYPAYYPIIPLNFVPRD